jgi:hypothetical protein
MNNGVHIFRLIFTLIGGRARLSLFVIVCLILVCTHSFISFHNSDPYHTAKLMFDCSPALLLLLDDIHLDHFDILVLMLPEVVAIL